MRKGAIERAYELARTGKYLNFTQVKKALRGEFAVDRELFGGSLSKSVTATCTEAQRRLHGDAARSDRENEK